MSHITLITSGRMQDSLLRQLIDYIIKRDWWFGCFVLKSIANYLMNSIETLLHMVINILFLYSWSLPANMLKLLEIEIKMAEITSSLSWLKSKWQNSLTVNLFSKCEILFFYGHTYFWNKTCHPNNKQTKIPQSKMNQPCFSLINTSLLNFTLLELFLCLRYCPLAYICM